MTFSDDGDFVWTVYKWRWLGEREATREEKHVGNKSILPGVTADD